MLNCLMSWYARAAPITAGKIVVGSIPALVSIMQANILFMEGLYLYGNFFQYGKHTVWNPCICRREFPMNIIFIYKTPELLNYCYI
jgi:hypothetical protein